MKKIAIPVFILLCAAVYGQETGEYKVSFTAGAGPALEVAEEISFTAPEGGYAEPLYRDLETVSSSALWVKKDKNFELLSVKRDGKDAPFTVQDTPFSKRVFLETPPPGGTYKYTFNYKASKLRFFDDADEIYLNMDGALNDFYPAKTEAVLTLPQGARLNYLRVFTARGGNLGPSGAEVAREGDVFTFKFPAPEGVKESYIIQAGLPKGVFTPGESDSAAFMRDNKKVILSLITLALIMLYYIIVWAALREEKIITEGPPRGTPPALTAAQARYLYKKIPGQIKDRYKILTSSLLELAVKGFIKIETDGRNYKLIRAEKAQVNKLSPAEKELFEKLFPPQVKVFDVSSKSERQTAALIRQNKAAVKNEIKEKYIRRNFIWETAGYCLGGAGVLFLFSKAGGGPFYMAFMLLLTAVVTLNFRKFFPPFTAEGVKAAAEIESFRAYLTASSGGKNYQDVFSAYMPYAVALGVENKWTRHFESEIETSYLAGRDPFAWLKITPGEEEFEEHHPSRAAALSYAAGAGFVEAFSRTKNISDTEDWEHK